MLAVKQFKKFFDISQNYSNVFALLCHTSAANDARIQSGLCQNTLIFPRIQVQHINHKFCFCTTKSISFEKKHDQPNSEEGTGVVDLASRTLIVESKRFYLDVKENKRRGRFIKLAEISSNGQKDQIVMSIPTAAQFCKYLEAMIFFYHGLEGLDAVNSNNLLSKVIKKEDKNYYFDLKENARGRFLQVSEKTHKNLRNRIFIPADGMEEFNNHLKELIEEYNDGKADAASV